METKIDRRSLQALGALCSYCDILHAYALSETLGELVELLEAPGEYYYEEVTKKRWILGPGGASGNCETCNDNADQGWIDMDDIFEGVDEDIDEPPAHPNCECEIEYKDTRQRVYV